MNTIKDIYRVWQNEKPILIDLSKLSELTKEMLLLFQNSEKEQCAFLLKGDYVFENDYIQIAQFCQNYSAVYKVKKFGSAFSCYRKGNYYGIVFNPLHERDKNDLIIGNTHQTPEFENLKYIESNQINNFNCFDFNNKR